MVEELRAQGLEIYMALSLEKIGRVKVRGFGRSVAKWCHIQLVYDKLIQMVEGIQSRHE